MRIGLQNGYAILPQGVAIVDLSQGHARDVGVIRDRDGELPSLVVISSASVRGLSVKQEEWLVAAAIADRPEYQRVQADELAYPSKDTCERNWHVWSDSIRLGFFPLPESHKIDGYRIVFNDGVS